MAAKARRATTAKKTVGRENFWVPQFEYSARPSVWFGDQSSGGQTQTCKPRFQPDCIYLRWRRGAFHGQINPRCLRNIFLVYSITAKTIGNMFNLVN